MGKIRITFLTICVIGLGACASKPEKPTCEARDWYELGRRDGAQGSSTEQLHRYATDCRKAAAAEWETMYTNGRNAGLVEYCSPDNGYELGRMGHTYLYVCPSTVEPQFLSSYRRGQRVRDLEISSKKISSKIETVAEQINRSQNQFERLKLTSELAKLEAERSQVEKKLDTITSTKK
ncbi:MAG: DUF2799 domain-containing protein [Bdellovibrionales bacterium]